MTADARRVAVLVSGRGSNLAALIRGADEGATYGIVLVASDRPEAEALAVARAQGIATWSAPARTMERTAFDSMLTEQFEQYAVGTIALAGYMRLLSPQFVERWRGRIVNIHPSLLPKYRGLDTHSRALAAGETVTGCTVHLVTEELDAGEILAQAEVPIEPGDDAASLRSRVLATEHLVYPAVLEEFVRR